MAEPTAYVYVDLEGTPRLAGRLWARVRGARESATFEYAEEWRGFEQRFALDPALQIGEAPHHTAEGRAIFAALGDSAPDRWGRTLIARSEARAASADGRAMRSLFEIDYLLAVSDVARQGALRFARVEGGPFVAADGPAAIPPFVELNRLLLAAEHVLGDEGADEDLRLLLAPGSSLGGARPKASIRDTDGALAIAKFPASSDPYAVVLWEAVALQLAEDGGIRVPRWRVLRVEGRPVLMLRRFDREGADVRRPFLSAMSMLGAQDGEMGSYLEIADALRQQGARPRADLEELWRRLVFSVLISNTDDHLRNHGFLYEGVSGWRLSPAYDLNPVPVDIKPRVLSTSIGLNADATASLELALEVVEYFDLDSAGGRAIIAEVADAVRQWRAVAERIGLPAGEARRLASAFEHEDQEYARGIHF
jgi:serine/threonine-protein kinase HipA